MGAAGTNPRSAGNLDDVNRVIVEELQRDGRTPFSAIGKVANLSEAAVRARVQRLLDTGVIRIVGVVTPEEVGLTRHATVGIKTGGSPSPVATALEELDEVTSLAITAGTFDILIDVMCESDEHLVDVVGNSIRTIPGVLATETFIHVERRRPSTP